MPDSELDRLDPVSTRITFSTGFDLDLQRLQTRQFLRLLKVVTHGAGPLILQQLNFSDGAEVFAQKLVTLVLIAVPDAENEFMAFLASMCKPTGIVEKPDKELSKGQKQDNQALWARFNEELANPQPIDTVELVEAIIRNEAPEMQALGKRLQAAVEVFLKTGQQRTTAEEIPGPEELASSVPSPQPLTSSPPSTDGQTSTSTASLFADSASA